MSFFAFQPQQLCTQIKIMRALEDDTDYKLKTLRDADLNLVKSFLMQDFCWKCFGIKRVSVAPSLLALVYLIALHLCTGNLFIIQKYEPASTSFCVFLLLDIYKPKTVNPTNRMNISALWCTGFLQQ